MIELTDLEIINKIVLIGGLSNIRFDSGVFSTEVVPGIRQEYNPLRNKALLFDLMLKYMLDIERCADGGGVVISYFLYEDSEAGGEIKKHFNNESEIPRAILECIIEANPSA